MAAQETEGTAAPAANSTLPAITVSEVGEHILRDRVVASGLVAAVEEVQVQPLVDGQAIEVLLADLGDRVEAGQVLAKLSGAALELQKSELVARRASVVAAIAQSEASLIEAQASAGEADRVATRNDALAAQGTIPRATADEAAANAAATRARVAVAEQGIASAQAERALVDAQVATLELQLARTEVRAPVAGLVVARNAELGAIGSAAGAPMFTLVRDGAMEMRAELSEPDLLRVKPGQSVTLSAMGAAERLTGTVRLVDPSIELDTRLGRARIIIDDPSRVVMGMFLTAEILVAEAEGLAIPVSAVGTGTEGSAVMRVRNGAVERVPVVTGIRDGDLIGVGGGATEGLVAGDLVVTRAGAFVREGDRINPVPDGTTTIAAQDDGGQP
ncbi:efflux RND transporter periplasmic adaptor subunit [Paracoccus liaowanqingii]|uniref:efflux RND transporter periplasmic adaptor subunit n=1 Tax=Paracoccus liaowanqingii TaxID=2560053 RepID=UPI001F0D9255|nr:efflux RND transporter periplasmic adaptor subunit [Paracoccus liaowanqingii]